MTCSSLRAGLLTASIALAGCTVGPPEPTTEPTPDADAFITMGQDEGEVFGLLPNEEFLFAVEHAMRDGEPVHVTRVESSDATVVEVVTDYHLITHSVGAAELRYFGEDGEQLGQERIDVMAPDEVVIVPLAAALTADSHIEAARAWMQTDFHVLRSTTIEAIPLNGGTRLLGFEAISGTGEGGVRLDPTTAGSFYEARFFFRLSSPGLEQAGDLALQFDGETVAQAHVVGAAEGDVAELELVDHEGWIWAKAKDEDGNVVLGPQAVWNPLPGDGGLGDLLSYDFDPDVERRTIVTASLGSVTDSVSVRMGDRGVSETRNSERPYGCSVAAPGRGAGGGFALVLVGGFLALRLRRRDQSI